MTQPSTKFWELKNKYDLLARKWKDLFDDKQHKTPKGQELLAEMDLLLDQISAEIA